jgi:CRP/FNR family cyclic AMP-dependent transcriptional regulator
MPVYHQDFDLGQIPLFSGLSEAQCNWVRGRLSLRVFSKHHDVVVAGMQGEAVYVVLSGTVKVYLPQLDGVDVIVAILGPGDPVGEMNLIDHSGHSASVVTLEETRALRMDEHSFNIALQTFPVLSQNLIQILNSRLRRSTGQIQALAALDVRQRVIHQLLAFASRYGCPGSSGETVIPIRLTQPDLAGLVGASRKRVNQAIVSLKRSGHIAIDREYHITIHQRAALEAAL